MNLEELTQFFAMSLLVDVSCISCDIVYNYGCKNNNKFLIMNEFGNYFIKFLPVFYKVLKNDRPVINTPYCSHRFTMYTPVDFAS